jgi:hypothetical protein
MSSVRSRSRVSTGGAGSDAAGAWPFLPPDIILIIKNIDNGHAARTSNGKAA